SAAVRQFSIADITLSCSRLTWPALASRHAGPCARKISESERRAGVDRIEPQPGSFGDHYHILDLDFGTGIVAINDQTNPRYPGHEFAQQLQGVDMTLPGAETVRITAGPNSRPQSEGTCRHRGSIAVALPDADILNRDVERLVH